MEPIRLMLPVIWAEKHLAPLLQEARACGGSLMGHIARKEFDVNAPDSAANSGTLQVVLCIVPKKSAERLRDLILTERSKLEMKAAQDEAKRTAKEALKNSPSEPTATPTPPQ